MDRHAPLLAVAEEHERLLAEHEDGIIAEKVHRHHGRADR